MKCFSAVVALCLVAVAQATTTVSLTTTVFFADITTITTVIPSTATNKITNQLPYSTKMILISSETATVTAAGSGAVTVTEAAGTVYQTVTAGTGGVVTVTGAAGAITTTVYSGSTVINSCVPTTTIITTVTSAVPTPVSPTGTIVTYLKRNCGSVVCPSRRKNVLTNGVAKACTLTMYGANLISSTCTVDFCCTAASGEAGGLIRTVTCKVSGITCPAGSSPLASSAGVSVPCLQTYYENKLVSTTCDSNVCCSAAAVVPVPSASVSCKKEVKCSVYHKDASTNYILKCTPTQCTTTYCCQKV